MELTENLCSEVSQAGSDYEKISQLFKVSFCDEARKMAEQAQFASAVFTPSPDSLTVVYAGASICFHLVAALPESGPMSGQVYVTRASHSLDGKKALLGDFSFSTSGATNIDRGCGECSLESTAQEVVAYFIKAALRTPPDTGQPTEA